MMRHLYVPSRRWPEGPPENVEDQARRTLRDTEIALGDAIETIHGLYFGIPSNPDYARAIISQLGCELEGPLTQALRKLKAMAEGQAPS